MGILSGYEYDYAGNPKPVESAADNIERRITAIKQTLSQRDELFSKLDETIQALQALLMKIETTKGENK